MTDTKRVKVLGICASPRRASTEWGVKLALRTAESLGYVDTEFIHLADYKLIPCNGCMKCFGWQHPASAPTPYCYEHEDDSGMLMAKMIESDGFIVGTPVYTLGVTSRLRILQEKTTQLGPMSFTKFAGGVRHKPIGVITVGGVDIAGQEAVAQDIWFWAMGLGMFSVGSWPTAEDPNPQASEHGGLVSTVDGTVIYGKDALSKAACRTTPPTQGSRNERALRNVGRSVGYSSMMLKLGVEAFAESGLKEPVSLPFRTYSVKPKKNSWIQKLIDDGVISYRPKAEVKGEKNPWETDGSTSV